MGKVFQLRTKKRINNKIDAGFIFNVPSVWSSGHPNDSEIKAALEAIQKGAGDWSAWSTSKYDIIS